MPDGTATSRRVSSSTLAVNGILFVEAFAVVDFTRIEPMQNQTFISKPFNWPVDIEGKSHCEKTVDEDYDVKTKSY